MVETLVSWMFFRVRLAENVFNCERKRTKFKNMYRMLKMSSNIKSKRPGIRSNFTIFYPFGNIILL